MTKAPTKISAARGLYVLNRAMKERLLNREFGTEQMRQAIDYFQKAAVEGCIYCESRQVERWDHLIPVRDGGATILGNMVPACGKCDDSKGARDYREWLSGKARYNPAKENKTIRQEILRRVVAYQKHFNFTPPTDFISALTPEQRAQYEAFSKLCTSFKSQLVPFGLISAQETEEEIEDEASE